MAGTRGEGTPAEHGQAPVARAAQTGTLMELEFLLCTSQSARALISEPLFGKMGLKLAWGPCKVTLVPVNAQGAVGSWGDKSLLSSCPLGLLPGVLQGWARSSLPLLSSRVEPALERKAPSVLLAIY